MRVTNGIPLGSSLLLPVHTVICVQTLKAKQVKLIDFGFSRAYLEGDTMSAFVGTSYYIAPEVLAGSYTAASDLWSLGVIAFMMVTGQCPFGGQTDPEIMKSVKNAAKHPKGTSYVPCHCLWIRT
jgi:serine/threonine protein kinase